ncbi:preprotein translocase subunit SecB [Marinomonas sp. IMCC 4694]|uniref:preprotein translocase subunit SecB n=1 Tax=Marinomonas sp. IMCC 4694 TaxID=2605432 RepID=UPI0011E65E2D|nr:preprotein translocase subunit SecB [Marinomonas sp. IMCC 4694]TYL49075.1 preprotein translocase subunit SecB [Marinomonas sp. IMCC 4694]
MAAKNSVSLQKAIDSLSIQDVYLKSSQAECCEDFDPKRTDHTELLVQQMHTVRRSEVLKTNEGELILKVYVRLGARWVLPIENDDPEVKAFVEADFIAEYSMAELLETEAVEEFSLKNASFHVWPYWREFLSSQCERLRLPRVVLPTVQFNC